MGSLFKPKMPPLPPVQPAPPPPSSELSQEEKDAIAAEQREIARKRRGRKSTILTGPLGCLLYTSPSPRDGLLSRMPSSA